MTNFNSLAAIEWSVPDSIDFVVYSILMEFDFQMIINQFFYLTLSSSAFNSNKPKFFKRITTITQLIERLNILFAKNKTAFFIMQCDEKVFLSARR